MLFTPLNHLAAHAGPPEPQDGVSDARRRLIRTGAAMLLAGWLSGLPNPSGSAPIPHAPAANLQGQTSAPHFAIPLSLLEEHAELYTSFEAAARVSGETGPAARRVIALRTRHVEKEHRIAYPLLRLMPMLGKDPVEPWMIELLPLADQLRAALPDLKREHVEIVRALDALHTAAWAEGHPEYAFLAQRLKHHIRIEEEILYPAALVTAEYVRGLKGGVRDFDRR
jgi:hypothetical protein